MAEEIEFVVNSRRYTLTRELVLRSLKEVDPEGIRTHYVVVGGRRFPVKQAFAAATGLDRLDFTSAVARRNLARLGFSLNRHG